MQKLKDLFTEIMSPGTTNSRLRELSVILMSAGMIAINLFVGVLFYFTTNELQLIFGIFAEVALLGFVIVLHSQKRTYVANLIFFLTLNCVAFYFGIIIEKDGRAEIMILFITGFAFFLFKRNWTRIICICFALINFFLIQYCLDNHITALSFGKSSRSVLYWISYLSFTSLSIFLFFKLSNTKRMLQKSKEDTETKLLKAIADNDAMKRFLKHTFHEAKSGFNSMRGMIDYLNNEERINKSGTTVEVLVQHIKTGAISYQRLLNNLLILPRLESGDKGDPIMELLAIRPFMEEIVAQYNFMAKAQSTFIKLEICKYMPVDIITDPIKLRQIASNLLHNAIKFVRHEGGITVRLEVPKPDSWQLCVINDGDTIPADILKSFFKPFAEARSVINKEGYGLGLYITHGLVAELQGRISVQRAENFCTEFIVELPCY